MRRPHLPDILVIVAVHLLLITGIVSMTRSDDDNGSGTVRPADRLVQAYFASWDIYSRGYQVADIPAAGLNVLYYAFAQPTTGPGGPRCEPADPVADFEANDVTDLGPDPDVDGRNLAGNYAQLLKLKHRHPGLKVLISVGGATRSAAFSAVAATAASRAAFARSCVATFLRGSIAPVTPGGRGGPGVAAGLFDGIDIDWEFPTQGPAANPADRHNATLLAQELRQQFDAAGRADGRRYLLTAAIPGGNDGPAFFELPQLARQLDWVNLMTYDAHTGSDPFTDVNSPLRRDPNDPNSPGGSGSVVDSVRRFRDAGVPAAKICVGVPFYGNQFIRTGRADNGLYQSFNNEGLLDVVGKPDLAIHPTYHGIVDLAGWLTSTGALHPSARSQGWLLHRNPLTRESWLFHPSAPHALGGEHMHSATVVTVPTPSAVADRVDLVRAQGLRGIFAWEISQDSDDHALLNEMSRLLP